MRSLRPCSDCGSGHELLIAKFRLKLKKVGKTTRPFWYDLNQIPYDYTVEVRKRFKGLDLIHRVPDELWNEVRNIVLTSRGAALSGGGADASRGSCDGGGTGEGLVLCGGCPGSVLLSLARVAQGLSGPSSSCVWNPRVFADDARGWQCPFVLCLHPQGCGLTADISSLGPSCWVH